MRRASEFVSRGEARAPASAKPAAGEGFAFDFTPPLSEQTPPNFLPRDYGMRGPVGAAEAEPLGRSCAQALAALDERFTVTPEKAALLEEVRRLVSPEQLDRLRFTSVSRTRVVLSVETAGERFSLARFLVPKLRAALRKRWGEVQVAVEVLPWEGRAEA